MNHFYCTGPSDRRRCIHVGVCIGQGLLFKETYVLVVDDHPFFTGGLVGAQVLVNTPITAPVAQNTATTTVCGKNRK